MVTAARSIAHIVPNPWNRDEFLDALAGFRGRPITLTSIEAVPLHGLPCGLWLAFSDHDEIVCHRSTSEYQIDQTILHEVGHMLLGHGGSPSADLSLATILPDIDLRAVRSVMKRSNFDDDQEGEAETFADLLMSAMVSRYRRSSAMDDFMGLT